MSDVRPIADVAKDLGIAREHLIPYGDDKAKIRLEALASKPKRGKLILVSAVTPTSAGEGKTTTSIGLAQGMAKIGQKVCLALREPSLGPTFGVKGGATGGGKSIVVPAEDINLHFTGDFHAITSANNLLASLVDNHIHAGNVRGIDPRKILWRRVIDLNDRSLRRVIIGLGGALEGVPRETGFDITPASEIMAIFCLTTSLDDLKERIGSIVVAYTRDRQPVRARDLHAEGAMTVLLKDALAPNLVQTLEHTPAFIHGGPFANIAHGCNSVIATESALKLADYVVTEAGFGADLGAEKFIDIMCRKSGLRPAAVVLVATVRALKYHGGQDLATIGDESLPCLEAGLVNLDRHVRNIRGVFGLPCVVAVNRFDADTPAEVDLLRAHVGSLGVPFALASHWSDGGEGAADLAHAVVAQCEQPSTMTFAYADEDSLWAKVRAVATRVYGATEVTADSRIRTQIKDLERDGYGHFPVCIAKTQYSFSTDPLLRGAPTGHSVNIREVRLAAGAEFIVMVCGDIMTMPGLPRVPSSERIDVVDGTVVGLF